MIKVLAQSAKYIFGIFGVGVLALLMSLTYQALGRIFPSSFENQIWGLIVFDIAAIVWALAFIFVCVTVAQYAAAEIGFVTAFVGTLGMVAAEVTLSGNLVDVDIAKIGQWLVWGFIGVTIIHATLIWVHHFGSPQISERVEMGIARGEITTAAMKQATHSLDVEKQRLAEGIHAEIYNRVLRDLGVAPSPIDGTPFDRRKSPTMDYPYLPGHEPAGSSAVPAASYKQAQESKPNFLSKILTGLGKGGKKYEWSVPNVTTFSPPPTPTPSPVQEDAEPAAGESKSEPPQ